MIVLGVNVITFGVENGHLWARSSALSPHLPCAIMFFPCMAHFPNIAPLRDK